MEREFLGVGKDTWLLLGALLLASPLIAWGVRALITAAFRARYRLAALPVPEWQAKGVRRATALLIAALLWRWLVPLLELPAGFRRGLLTLVDLVAIAGAVWLLSSLWDAAAHLLSERTGKIDQRAEKLLIPVTRKLVRVLIFVAGGVAALAAFHVNVAGLLAGLGIGGLILALAAKDSVENIFGSITILFDMPFALGDWVKIGPVEGIVEEINLRSTRIRTFEDSVVTLPNSNLIRASVENFGARRVRRQRFPLKFALDARAEDLESFCREFRAWLQARRDVAPDRLVVELNEVGESWAAVLVQCYLHVDSAPEELRARAEILAEGMRLAERKGLRFAGGPAAAPPAPDETASLDLKSRGAPSPPTPVLD